MGDIKILRQNQDAGGRVLKQNESAGGKILKQNYNFGKILTPTSSLHLQNPLVGDFSILNYNKSLSIGDYILLRDGSVDNYKLRVASGNDFYWFQSGSIFAQILGVPYIGTGGKMFSGFCREGSSYKRVLNQSIANGTGLNSALVINNIFFQIRSVAVVYIFNRCLSDAEIQHVWNNSNGNSPLSTLGLIGYYKYERAEILNAFDGVNVIPSPSIRDYSGFDNHIIINGLPSGTLEEQVEYANINRFLNYT